MARKFDVGRGLMLYEQHEATRIREGLVRFEPTVNPLRNELETGKFTVLVKLVDFSPITITLSLQDFYTKNKN